MWGMDIHDENSLTIDCATCTAQNSPTCEDCVVTFLCLREPGDAVVIDLAEARALRVLTETGLAPPVRYRGISAR
ncbi:MAG TPA: hypothetical protein EYG34_09705 [Acidimicrobiia bacterium]|nr:hypothetical protein [Acidimicrobiia bacterium]HIL47368.1 hypothetical protein [Acidimicrobiia bacterium]